MAIWHLEPKHIKVKKKTEYFYCPNPQYNQYCNGVYVKTRKWQIECVECMKAHGTISRHPMLKKVACGNTMYGEYDILIYEQVKAQIYGNKKQNEDLLYK